MIDITEKQAKILLSLNGTNKEIIIDRDKIEKNTSIPRTTVFHVITSLIQLNLVEPVKVPLNNTGRATVFYRLTKDGKDLVEILLYNKPDITIRDRIAWSSRYIEKLLEEKKK